MDRFYIAIHDISVESFEPKGFVPSGGLINLENASDSRIKVLLDAGIVAPLDTRIHLLSKIPEVPASAKNTLSLAGIYTAEDVLNDKPVTIGIPGTSPQMKTTAMTLLLSSLDGVNAEWLITVLRDVVAKPVEPYVLANA